MGRVGLVIYLAQARPELHVGELESEPELSPKSHVRAHINQFHLSYSLDRKALCLIFGLI